MSVGRDGENSLVAQNKTKPTAVDPAGYVAALDNPVRKRDAGYLMQLFSEVTGEKPKMWGPSIIGFGQYHYTYASGREGDAFVAGFAPRKTETVIYLMGALGEDNALMGKLGKHRMGKGCLYIKDLEAVDKAVLKELLVKSHAAIKARYA